MTVRAYTALVFGWLLGIITGIWLCLTNSLTS